MLKYLGNSLFEVVTSENAKLKPGDRFLCQRFTMNQPLYVELLTQDGNTELFVMGNKGGLTKCGLCCHEGMRRGVAGGTRDEDVETLVSSC